MLAAARPGLRHHSTVVGGFSEDFNRTDRELVGDNGWYNTLTTPYTGHYSIVSNRFRCVAGNSGQPGGGTIGAPLAHDVTGLSADTMDLSLDIITGSITTLNGSYLWIVLGATQNAATPPTINTGVVLQWFLDTTTNQMGIGKITATNSTTPHNPVSFPACAANATTTLRAVLTRSTGVLQVYTGGVLRHTSSAGDFSSLTGTLIAFQQQSAYSTTPYEIDNVVVV